MISDTAAIFLAVALLLSNVERIFHLFHWIWVSVARLCGSGRPSRRAVPYWSQQGEFLGMVLPPDQNPRSTNNAVELVGQSISLPQTLRDCPRKSATELHTQLPLPPSRMVLVWDGWPDGAFSTHLTSEDMKLTSSASINWSCDSLRIDTGKTRARTWQQGRETRKICRGVFKCESSQCPFEMLAAADRSFSVGQALGRYICLCGARLQYVTCGTTSSIHRYAGGALFVNRGSHTHTNYTHVLKISSNGTFKLPVFVPRREPVILQSLPARDLTTSDMGTPEPTTEPEERLKYTTRSERSPDGFESTNFGDREREWSDEERREIEMDPEADQDED
ncbi:unnamed protein product [Mycena citricolor]|uniref:Uncharacterized protein n=1 Tax=Mycena citricolor TaxID=2018698 RepID=A0AAD2HL89_9AGAR|nr:unnamed protein product [Mycena citricolor]